MFHVNGLVGFGANGLTPGPFEISYVGYNTVTTSTNSASYNIGVQYSDRIVFIGIINRYTTATSVTVGGLAATQIATELNGSSSNLEWWCMVAPPGVGSVNITSTHVGGYMNTVVVYLLKGGAGLYPTFTKASAYVNNTNTITGYFPDAVKINDIALSIGLKSGSVNFGGHLSNISPLVNNVSNVNASDGGSGWALIGPATSTIVAGSAYVQALGSDNTKLNSFLAIKFSKL